ncbi:MAG TPA: porin family protein, partial [Flavisolibacter sp.]|nr:porin family protein [Flavisolibacter sp.]
AGLFANIPIGGLLRFQPELLYNSMGAKVKATTVATGSTLTESYEQDLTYISLPLMLQVQSPGGFFVEAGPQVSYLVDATKDGPGETETENEPIFDKIDIGASAGIGYMSRVGLGIGARYNFGLTNILDEGQSKDGPELKNRVLSIGLVYQFGANK